MFGPAPGSRGNTRRVAGELLGITSAAGRGDPLADAATQALEHEWRTRRPAAQLLCRAPGYRPFESSYSDPKIADRLTWGCNITLATGIHSRDRVSMAYAPYWQALVRVVDLQPGVFLLDVCHPHLWRGGRTCGGCRFGAWISV